MDSRDIIRSMYPEVLRPGRWYQRLGRRIRGMGGRLLRRFNRWAKAHAWHLVLLGVACGAWAYIHISYYNRIVGLEFNVQTAWAQVESEQKRRYNIQQTVVRAVIAYAHHEKSLMTDLTELRTSAQKRLREKTSRGAVSAAKETANEKTVAEQTADKQTVAEQTADKQTVGEQTAGKETPGSPTPTTPEASVPIDVAGLDKLSPEQLDRLFPSIMLVAEQYPNLRLTENYQQLTTAVIETETRIAERVQAYNDAVNMYTTMLRTFPGILFAKLWGFKMYDFYEPAAEELVLRPMQFEPEASSHGTSLPATSPPEPGGP